MTRTNSEGNETAGCKVNRGQILWTQLGQPLLQACLEVLPDQVKVFRSWGEKHFPLNLHLFVIYGLGTLSINWLSNFWCLSKSSPLLLYFGTTPKVIGISSGFKAIHVCLSHLSPLKLQSHVFQRYPQIFHEYPEIPLYSARVKFILFNISDIFFKISLQWKLCRKRRWNWIREFCRW